MVLRIKWCFLRIIKYLCQYMKYNDMNSFCDDSGNVFRTFTIFSWLAVHQLAVEKALKLITCISVSVMILRILEILLK